MKHSCLVKSYYWNLINANKNSSFLNEFFQVPYVLFAQLMPKSKTPQVIDLAGLTFQRSSACDYWCYFIFPGSLSFSFFSLSLFNPIVNAVIPARPPSCIVSSAELGTITIVEFVFNPSYSMFIALR